MAKLDQRNYDAAINTYKDAYNRAKAAGDTKGMQNAHNQAEALRKSQDSSYTGSVDGSRDRSYSGGSKSGGSYSGGIQAYQSAINSPDDFYNKYKSNIDGLAKYNNVDSSVARSMFQSNLLNGGQYKGAGKVDTNTWNQMKADAQVFNRQQPQNPMMPNQGYMFTPQATWDMYQTEQQNLLRNAQTTAKQQKDALTTNYGRLMEGLRDNRALENNFFNRTNNPFSGGTSYRNAIMERERAVSDRQMDQDLQSKLGSIDENLANYSQALPNEILQKYMGSLKDQFSMNQQNEQLKLQQNAQKFNQDMTTKQFDYQAGRDKVSDAQWQKQFDEDTRRFGLNYALQKLQENRLASGQSSSLSNQAFDNNLALSKTLGYFQGIPGIEDGTPIPGGSSGMSKSDLTSAIDQRILKAAQLHRENPGSEGVFGFIKNQIVPDLDELTNMGYGINDINGMIDRTINAFTNGQFKTKYQYFEYLKKNMGEKQFEQWKKENDITLNFNVGKKGGEQAQRWAKPITSAANKHGVPSNILYNMMVAESGGNPNVRSSAGAIGLMQFMPGTAKGMGIDPTDPHQSIDGAARYLKGLYDQFGDWRLAVAAYNAGPGNVKKYKGIPPFKETQNYVKKVFT